MLMCRMPIGRTFPLGVKVFLLVDEIDHLDHTWSRFRLTEQTIFSTDVAAGKDIVTVRFVENIPDKVYDATEEVDVLLTLIDRNAASSG
jgi:hypothetical protein